MRSAAAAPVVAVLLSATLAAAPATAQLCSDTQGDGILVEMIPGTGSVASAEPRCLGAFYCEETDIGAPQTEAIFDPESGTYTVRVKVPLTMPDNSKNDGTDGTYTGLRARVHWFADAQPPVADCYPGFNGCTPFESCGPLGATIDFDQGFTSISIAGLTCQNLEGNARLTSYSFSVLRCASPFGSCTTRADSSTIDLSPAAVGTILPCAPKHTCCSGACDPCPDGGAGVGGAGLGGGGGAGLGGGGAVSCPLAPRDGSGAALGYTARGAGTPGLPGSAAWRQTLGRGWSHDYAERIVPDPDDSHVWLITRFGTYREFWGLVDGVYEKASPSDEYRTLTRTPSGWELRDLDGTVQSFDADGRWTGTADANGNAKLPTYDVAGTLTDVAFPDGRSERFTYHPDGKLAAIEEIGVGGSASRTWSYTWAGDNLVRIDRPDGTAAEYFYNDPRHPGYLTRVDEVATNGARRIDRGYQHDAEGNVVRVWSGETASGANGDAPGPGAVNVWALSFDDPKLPTQTLVTDPLGNVSTYGIGRDPTSEVPRIDSISGDCPACGLGPNAQFFYDDPENPLRPTRTVDGRATQTVMTYGANGRMTSMTEALGTPLERMTTWEYGDAAFPAVATKIARPSTSGAGARETRITLDGAGNPVTRTISGIEDGSAFSFDTVTTFTPEGRPLQIDPPGYGTADQTSFTYDPVRGNLLPLTRSDPLIGATSFSYDPFNRATAKTDANGVTTETVYDAMDRVQAVIRRGASPAEDLVIDLDYDGFGDLVRTTMPEESVIEYSYDDVGRLVTIARGPTPNDPRERTVLARDEVGNITLEETQRWEGASWVTRASQEFLYSSRCRLDKILHPDGSTTEFAYDCNGNRERIWDANHPSAGQTSPPSRLHAYDALNRLVSVSQPWSGPGGGQATTAYAYDVQDHLVRATDAEENVTGRVFSDRDLLTEQLSEVSGRTTYSYNEHGAAILQTDARQVSVHRSFDALDRVIFVDYPENALDTSYTYDDPAVPFSRGRLTAITRDGGAVEYEYDRFGRVTRDGRLTFGYDDNGNQTTIGYPEGVTATYTYDFADRPATLILRVGSEPPQAIVTAVEYLPSGPPSRLDLGNGLSEIRDFDQRYFPLGIEVPGQLDWDYTTDSMGNVLAITDTLFGESRSFDFQDHHYYLIRGDGPWGDLSWAYDRIGNRLTETRNGATSSYRYPTNEAGGRNPKLAQVLSAAAGNPIRYFYDAAGNRTFEATDDRKLRLSINAQGRLAQVALDSASTDRSLSSFTYDGRSLLNRSDYRPFLGRAASIITTPTYGSNKLLYHRRTIENPAPQPPRSEGTTTTDTFVLYFPGRPAAIFDRIVRNDAQGGSSETSRLRFTSTDHIGAPVLLTDGAATATWRAGLEPFGSVSGQSGEEAPLLRLPGQWRDISWNSADLNYNVYRWYSPRLGRYSAPDRFWDPQRLIDMNPYGYGGQNPTSFIDPLGLATWYCEYTYGNVGLPPGSPVTGGVTGLWLNCKSECEAGKRVSVKSRALLGGASLGILPFGVNSGNAKLTDPSPRASAAAFEGFTVLGGFGGTFWKGAGCLSLTIGDNSTDLVDCGVQQGVDLGSDVYAGWSFLTDSTDECCTNDPSRPD